MVAATTLPGLSKDNASGYDDWLLTKLTRTMQRLYVGETELPEHDRAVELLRQRIRARIADKA